MIEPVSTHWENGRRIGPPSNKMGNGQLAVLLNNVLEDAGPHFDGMGEADGDIVVDGLALQNLRDAVQASITRR